MLKHDFHLDVLINDLSLVEEKPNDIEWIMKEGIWMQQGSTDRLKLCDIICVYYGQRATCLELKSSRKKRSNGIEQLYHGELFVRKNLGISKITKKMVYYSNKGYNWENIL